MTASPHLPRKQLRLAEKHPHLSRRAQRPLPATRRPGRRLKGNYLGSAIQWPFLVGVPITTDFGPRIPSCDGCSSFHEGIDMNPGVNTPIQAVANGVVREVSSTGKSGLGVYAIIDHMIDGRLVSSLYAHMTEGTLAFAVGDPVLVGQLVGNVGNTGQSTGPHLHFEILLDGVTPTAPYAWLTDKVSAS
ncbi:M23 family metallopeptidase [Cryobacterium sp. SO2]|uniref:M23 family metallopeptidase n=1 Tax=Cryobacterium sp. SO2 TaxID=1897060 RepID=UPI00223D9EAA|nr:M23 family metallopeptidase [Cryobacterium sp. SO2]WEO76000.1 M23 family metallopeptidase [Cryobacterium sp. SO2]